MKVFAYNLALGLGLALAAPMLAARLAKGRYRAIAAARLGLGSAWLPPASSGGIWVHALSVGEVRSALPLLAALGRCWPQRPLALSVATAQGLAVARQELAKSSGVSLFVRPLDTCWNVERLLDRLRPALFCLVEGDIWPGWSWGLTRRGVPSLLVNGRVSPRTFKGYRRLGGLAKGLFSGFDRVLVQTGVDHQRLARVGVDQRRLAVGGNLKFDTAPARLDPAARQALAGELGLAGRRVLAAGSTHAGEDEACLQAFLALEAGHAGLALLLAPRQVERGRGLARLAAGLGLSAALLSQGAPPQGAQVVILDVLGRLAPAYALAEAAFVGGSLVPVGGHNLLEPAAQGVPVLFGPHTHNFLEMARDLEACGGGARLAGPQDLAAAWGRLLDDPARAQAMGQAGLAFCQAHRGALQRALSEAAFLLEGGRA
ncbi:MAG: glycosyltransferase N-terminal domain-containing protein [Pseudomonadota bacterium]